MTKHHAILVFALALAATGCGKDKENKKSGVRTVDTLNDHEKDSTTAPVVTVTIVAAPAGALDQGASFQFDALVSGTDETDVQWSTVGGGRIDANGLFVAPAGAGEVTVVATSVADADKKDEVKVTINPVSLTAAGPAALFNTETADYAATVAGTKLNSGVAWSVVGSGDVGTIDAAGLFTPNMTRGAYAVLIVATSQADASKTAQINVQVNAATFAVTPAALVVFVNEQAQVGITAAGMSATANYSVDGGAITAGGLYTAPATVGAYTITAVHPTFNSFMATAAVTVVLRPIITINVASTQLLTGSTASFSAAVTDGSAGVTWSILEGAAGGTIDAAGNYTAPAAGGVFHIVATHAEYPGASAILEVNVCTAFDTLVSYWAPTTLGTDAMTLRVRVAYGGATTAHTTYQDLNASWLETPADDVLAATSYSGPGLDGAWLTADDEAAAYISLTADASGRQNGYALHGTAGTDGAFGTADDEILERAAFAFNGAGYVQEVTRYTGAGLDGTWGTGDDAVGGYLTFTRGVGHDVLIVYDQNASRSVTGYRTYVNDAFGRPVTVTAYTHPGQGNVWEDGNDRYTRTFHYAYDGDGRLAARTEKVYVGPTNSPQPQNDTRVTYAYTDASRVPAEMMQYRAGGDKLIATGDDVVAAWSSREAVCPW